MIAKAAPSTYRAPITVSNAEQFEGIEICVLWGEDFVQQPWCLRCLTFTYVANLHHDRVRKSLILNDVV